MATTQDQHGDEDSPERSVRDAARPSGAHAGEFWNRSRFRRRSARIIIGLVALALCFGGLFAWSFSRYVKDSQGEPVKVLLAEWGRDHHLGWFVAQAENFYYDNIDVTPTGGTPTESTRIGTWSVHPPTSNHSTGRVQPHASSTSSSARRQPTSSPAASDPAPPAHLDPPPTVLSPVAHSLPDEGVWQPVGATVEGVPAVYATRVRADNVHTSVLASMMWIDTKLAVARFVPGFEEPGGPNPSNGSLPTRLQSRVLANFNGAFRLQDSRGGYYFQGHTVRPLVPGAASAVLTSKNQISIGRWGRDLHMSSDVVAVRQNLSLIVDHGKSLAGQQFSWGATTHGENYAWRSAIGERADHSIVYIGSPGLSAAGMADTLVRAGVQRAMVLDMNNWWVAGFYFTHRPDGTPQCHKLDPAIQESCNRFLNPYKRDSFQFLARN